MAPALQQPTPSETITIDASSESNNVTITGKIYTRVRLATKSDLSHIYQLFYQIHEYHNYTHLYKSTESSLANLLFKENPLPLFYGPSVLLLEVSPTPFNEPKNTTNEGFKPVLTTFDLKFPVVEGQVEEFRSKYDDKSDAYIAGYAFFYANYSCFNDKPGFYFERFKPVLTTFDLKFPVVEGQVEEFRSKYDDKSDAYIAGYAFFYANYSCFYDKPGFYFESLYFRESYRKLGMGKLLFGTVASIAANNGFVSVEGIIAVWNKKSYDFYINMGVEIFDEFRYGKLHGENLQKYADNKGEIKEANC
uniref:N-hydroxycinnamoyl-CoA:tyramine N-hydroxycinnamoyl transferase THT7-1 n=1 Tax=Solanum tuberosum TaxID=4113 RepID=M1B6L2_SOLTU